MNTMNQANCRTFAYAALFSLLLVATAFYGVLYYRTKDLLAVQPFSLPLLPTSFALAPQRAASQPMSSHSDIKYFHYSHFNSTTQWQLTSEMKQWQSEHAAQFTQKVHAKSIADDISILIHNPSEDLYVSGAFKAGRFWDEDGMAAIAKHVELILTSNGIKPCDLSAPLSCDHLHEQHRMGVLDIGANIGSYSLGFAKYFQHRYPLIDVFSFEPLWLNYMLLMRSIQLNKLHNIYLFPYGLSTEHAFGNKSFVIDTKNKGHSHVDGDHSWSENDGLKVNIETASLDLLLDAKLLRAAGVTRSFENVMWMKIDTEGYEKFVFGGGKHFLSRADVALFH